MNKLPEHLQSRYKLTNDGYIIQKNASPIVLQALEEMRDQARRKALIAAAFRDGQQPADSGQWGVWNISDRD